MKRIIGILCLVALPVSADGVPTTQPFQYAGYLERLGAPVSTAVLYNLELWSAATGGTKLCGTMSPPLQVIPVAGRFRVPFDASCAGTFRTNPEMWIQLTVNVTGVNEVLPRTKVSAVGFASQASHAETANSATSATSASSAANASAATGALNTRIQALEISGMVAFFNLAACPAGWSELTAARGRYVVGKPTGGTLAGTAGTALTDLENRPVGQHAHSITDPGHNHTAPVVPSSGGGGGDSLSDGIGGANVLTGTRTTGISIQNAGAVAGTNAPYLQLLVCQKN